MEEGACRGIPRQAPSPMQGYPDGSETPPECESKFCRGADVELSKGRGACEKLLGQPYGPVATNLRQPGADLGLHRVFRGVSHRGFSVDPVEVMFQDP